MENKTTNEAVKPQIIVAETQKSEGISIILTLLFGSLGLFYSTITGGLVMTFLFTPAVLFIFFSTGSIIASILIACLYYPICVIWGFKSVKSYNNKLLNGEDTTEKFDFSLYDIILFLIFSAFIFCAIYAFYDMVLNK